MIYELTYDNNKMILISFWDDALVSQLKKAYVLNFEKAV